MNISNELLTKFEENHDLIIELYQYKNYTSEQIAEKLNTSKSSLDRYRYMNDIHRLYKDKDWFKSKFIDEKLSLVAIAKICNCSPNTITRFAIKHGLHEKKTKRKLKVNDNFFSEYNKKSCYWAGFINADGHISKENRYYTEGQTKSLTINLSLKDVKHLRKLNKSLTRDNLIREYESNSYKMCSLKLARQLICDDLNSNFDIAFNQKSLNEIISSKIPNEFLRDFIRGHFDGDGSISISKNGGVFLTVIGSKNLCDSFKRIVDNEYNKDIGKIVQDSKNKDMYLYRVTNSKDCALIYLYMYYKDCVHLERKRDIFKEILCKI